MTDGVRGSNLPTGTDIDFLFGYTDNAGVKTSKQIGVDDLAEVMASADAFNSPWDFRNELYFSRNVNPPDTPNPPGADIVVPARDEIVFYTPEASWDPVHDAFTSLFIGYPIGGLDADHDTPGEAATLEARYSVLVGPFAGLEMTTSSYMAGVGHEAFRKITTGSWSSGVGEAIGAQHINSNRLTLVGWKAGHGVDGVTDGADDNVFVGYAAGLWITTGTSNIGIGTGTMQSITFGVTGSYNTVAGDGAAPVITSGSLNSIWGFGAGANITTATSNIFIGSSAGNGITTGSNNTVIGTIVGLDAALSANLIIGTGNGVKRIWATSQSTIFTGTNDNTFFEIANNVSSPVNWLKVSPSATGNGVIMASASGTDASVSILFQTRQSSATATRMTLALGLVMGSATGGDKGAGTINAVGVYDDNVLLTDFVFDLWYDGSYNQQRYAKHPVAANFNKDWFDVRKYGAWVDEKHHMPATGTWANDNVKPTTGELATRHTAELELHTIHAQQLARENDDLKARIAKLEAVVEKLMAA